MRLAQITDGAGKAVVVTDNGESRKLEKFSTIYALAMAAISVGRKLQDEIAGAKLGEPVDLAKALSEGRVLSPLMHSDPAHTYVTGTGLTHLGSAEGRDKMHKDLADAAKLT